MGQQLYGKAIGGSDGIRFGEIFTSAEQRMDSGQKNRQFERLCNLVIAAHIKSHDHVGFFIRSG